MKSNASLICPVEVHSQTPTCMGTLLKLSAIFHSIDRVIEIDSALLRLLITIFVWPEFAGYHSELP